ncbi:GNAT family N-acetyltransferase [Azospirillum canadense]|uniref:GNAT family N-acetyltransferase n=1 Tax=Azospirillum canadense TaxID=403962 RepID=UPI002227E797|nr:GNAT family N-acetyltransferase [Azospirillum canadense]MCW2240903.1 CelD/BcsL family acetyltransferase involved in cellulose biosynthesis [Azospirillum canadense]
MTHVKIGDGIRTANAAFAARPLGAHVVSPADLTPSEVARWNELCVANPLLASPFLTFAYARVCAEVFHAVRVCVLTRGNEALGFFPFQFRSPTHRLLGLAERLGGELSDYFGLLAAPQLVLTASELLRSCRLNALFFTHLDEAQAVHGLQGEQPETGLRIRMPAGGEPYWEELRRSDKRFVNDTERRERKLVAANGELRFVFRHATPLPHLEFLLARKREQYERTNAKDSLATPSARKLLAQLAQSDDALCRGVVSTLHAGDTWVASHFGLMCGGTLHYWFPVYNPELQSFSPGRLLLKSIIQMAPDLGITLIDRGAGDTQAKRDFANECHTFTRGLWTRATPQATAFQVALAAGWRLERLRGRLFAASR